MMFRIQYMHQAKIDLEGIRVYLSQYYAGTKKRFFTSLYKKTSIIKKYPFSCPVYEIDPDYRKLVVGDYLVLYIIDEDRAVVEIHRIFHGSWDILKQLNSDSEE